jgi:hypothetical protein
MKAALISVMGLALLALLTIACNRSGSEGVGRATDDSQSVTPPSTSSTEESSAGSASSKPASGSGS